jgi:hypothetical protein
LQASKKLVGELLSAKADAPALERVSCDVRVGLGEVRSALERKADVGRVEEVVRGLSQQADAAAAQASQLSAALDAAAAATRLAVGQLEQGVQGLRQAVSGLEARQDAAEADTTAHGAQVCGMSVIVCSAHSAAVYS